MLKPFLAGGALLLASACAPPSSNDSDPAGNTAVDTAKIDAILAALPEDEKARIQYRNPKETLGFFGITPGMDVVDTMPGDVWYSGILARYLGADGHVIGADRPLSVWESFGAEYSPPQFLANRPNWTRDWPKRRAAEFSDEQAAAFDAVAFGDVPATFDQSADAILVMREFHNIMAADPTDQLAVSVLGEMHRMLRPGGVLGIVQHRAPESADNAWANGANGYVKQSRLIALVERAGFTFEASSEINANPADQPGTDEYVWRLPPDLLGSEEDPELRQKMREIGESDRMTLRFRKAS